MSINIKPDREYLREICAKIENGRYAIPVFQRNYVWTTEQILELFDSIEKGYPIGTVILWKPTDDFLKQSKDILTDEKKNAPTPDYYVLDGRQRLTTFYGCIKSEQSKEKKFKLSYNLDKGEFEYSKEERIECLLLSDIYDTFTLVGKLVDIQNQIKDKDKARKYVDKARRMNSILQSYAIGEIMIDDCSLDDATVAFSRINSKGTQISKTFMLQAISYKGDGGELLSDEINKILASLEEYSFDGLNQDDILNCFYKYVDKQFFAGKMSELENIDFTPHFKRMGEDIKRTVEFLYKDCYVISSKLLPYKKQLVILSGFFKEHPQPTLEQKKELKRWFYYTTYQQSFQNSSLSIVREQVQRFDEFVNGDKNTAMDYKPVTLSHCFDFRFDLRAAKADFLTLTQINYYAQQTTQQTELQFTGYIRMGDNIAPEATIPYLNSDDKSFLRDIRNGTLDITTTLDEKLEKYILTTEMTNLIKNMQITEFKEKRTTALVDKEKLFLESLNIEIQTPEI
jgi:uncharacterized protein with ParB-like and HNH nuclease domain